MLPTAPPPDHAAAGRTAPDRPRDVSTNATTGRGRTAARRRRRRAHRRAAGTRARKSSPMVPEMVPEMVPVATTHRDWRAATRAQSTWVVAPSTKTRARVLSSHASRVQGARRAGSLRAPLNLRHDKGAGNWRRTLNARLHEARQALARRGVGDGGQPNLHTPAHPARKPCQDVHRMRAQADAMCARARLGWGLGARTV